MHRLRIVNFAGGVVQDHNQVMPALILKPQVMATVDTYHLVARVGGATVPLTLQLAPRRFHYLKMDSPGIDR